VNEDQINDAVNCMQNNEKENDIMPTTMTQTTPTQKPLQTNNRGLDIGTMNLVQSRMNSDGTVSSSSLRNMYLKIDPSNAEYMDLSKVSHTKIDNATYVLSQHAYEFANIFDLQVDRPMHKGMISSQEIDSLDIISQMIKNLIGEGTPGSVCCYSVPADPIDDDRKNLYHEKVFGRVLEKLGYKAIPLNEATAVVYSECADSNFTGIGISFGAGMTNIAVVFKSVPVITFSVTRGGDWIDSNVSLDTGIVTNRITSIKEKDSFSLIDFAGGNKRERRIKEAISHYYNNLISYTTKHILAKLDSLTVDFPDDVPIILSGGTSKANGFIDLVTSNFENYDFPFNISSIKVASNQLTAVAEGCLIKSLKL
jgi:actin-like ATPase involved in cell morphogenesis